MFSRPLVKSADLSKGLRLSLFIYFVFNHRGSWVSVFFCPSLVVVGSWWSRCRKSGGVVWFTEQEHRCQTLLAEKKLKPPLIQEATITLRTTVLCDFDLNIRPLTSPSNFLCLPSLIIHEIHNNKNIWCNNIDSLPPAWLKSSEFKYYLGGVYFLSQTHF